MQVHSNIPNNAVQPIIHVAEKEMKETKEMKESRTHETFALDIDVAERLVKEYMEKNRRMAPAFVPERPLREYAERMQDTEDSGGLILQAEVHAQMAGLFAAFSFSALIAENSSTASGLSKTDNIIAQIRVCMQLMAMLLLLTATSRCMWITVALTTQTLKHNWRAMSPSLTGACTIFHQGLFVFVLDMPLYIYGIFGLKPAFFVSIVFILYWLKTFLGNAGNFLGLMDLLIAIDVGQTEPAPSILQNPSFGDDIIQRRRKKKAAKMEALKLALTNETAAPEQQLPRPQMWASQIAGVV
jgi:hypothetical protein